MKIIESLKRQMLSDAKEMSIWVSASVWVCALLLFLNTVTSGQ